MSTRAKSFWSTMPGLITGLAGILTGLVGLGTLLIQLEVIGGDGDSTPKFEPGRTATTRAGGSQPDGTAAVARFAVSPSSLDVTTNKTESVTVENTGTKVLSVQQPVLTGSGKDQFTVRSDCGQLQVDDTCTVTVTFKGLLNASAIMTVRAGDGASPKEVTLEGRPV